MVFTPQKEIRSRSPQSFGRFLSQLQDAVKAAEQQGAAPGRFPGQSPLPNSHGGVPLGMTPGVTPSCLSVALPLPDIDPLRALEELGGFQVPHFYWEQPSQGLAIAAAHAALQATFQGPQRFSQAQVFVNQQQRRMVLAGERSLPGAQPRFFCSFTFFDQVAEVSPFPPATMLLPRWQVVRQGQANRHLHQHLPRDQGESTFVANFRLHRGQVDRKEAHEAWDIYGQLQALSGHRLQPVKRTPGQSAGAGGSAKGSRLHCQFDGEAFEASVAAVLEAIDGGDSSGQLHKAVMAQVLKVQSEFLIDPSEALVALRSRHPDCYSFSVGNGAGAVFLGASPERLIQVRQRHLYTEALAGSAPRGVTPATDIQLAQSLRTSPKELHEHQLVADFIEQQLEDLGLTPQRAAEPQVFQLTGIQHLQTPIDCALPQGIHPFEVLAQLHPTPAVGGVPQQSACAQIEQLEKFERSLYASPLGWIDGQGNCEFCVGIRSALLQGNEAQLFAGAGIVSGSEPAQERAEVELKLRTLLLALTNQSGQR